PGAATASSGLANRGLGGHTRGSDHVWFSHRAGVVRLRCATLHRAILQLPRSNGLAESNARAIAMVSSSPGHAEKPVGRFLRRLSHRFRRLAAQTRGDLVEIFAPTLAAIS